jgi:hypothetical protein
VWTWWIIVVAAVGSWAAPSATAQERSDEGRHLVEILEGLEHGLAALKRLGLHDEYERLQRVANDVRGELRHHRGRSEAGPRREDREARRAERPERQIVEGQIEALELALPALREAERRDAVELVERAIGARRTMLEGRRDEEARRIRERAPGRQQIVELLVGAEDIYREFRMEERAAALSRMTEELWQQRRRSGQRAGDVGRREAANELEVMRMALSALKEAGRQDAAALLGRAIRAREVQLEGRRDREATQIRRQAPTLEEQIELLAYAARLWRDFGHERKAEVIARLAERKRAALRRGDGGRRGGEPRREALLPRLERLEDRVAELERGLAEIKGRLRAAGERRRRGGGATGPR